MNAFVDIRITPFVTQLFALFFKNLIVKCKIRICASIVDHR